MNVECLAYAHKHDLTMCSVPVDTRGKENKDEKGRKENIRSHKRIASVPGFVPETIRKTFRVLGNSDHAI